MKPGDADLQPSDAMPEALRERLRDWDARPVSVAPEADREIRRRIGDHFSRARRFRRWPWPVGIAAAAALVLAVSLDWTGKETPEPRDLAAGAAVEGDLDGNGRLDVLDAFLVARRLASDEPAPAHFDVNRDGVVDRRDADRLASLAVRLTDD